MKISRIMSTQHPDNVNIPSFAENEVMNGDDEVKEAFHLFSDLEIDEQLWDAEGKETDNFVVKKLLSKHPDYFQKNILGKDKFLTLRVPNPEVETDEGKILLEALHSIPRNADIGKKFYSEDSAPIFEIVMPMCSSDKQLIRVHEYYKQLIVGSQKKVLCKGDLSIAEWLGKLYPKDIRVTPLFETKEAILNSDKYVEKYMQFEKIKEIQRVWFARSDPALNYGSLANVLIVKIGLNKLQDLQEKTSIDILPILGCGSAPFRGNFKPTNVSSMLKGYPSVQTFTAQSAFKYDFPIKEVINGVEEIKNTKRKKPCQIDYQFGVEMVEKIAKDYQESITMLAPMINNMSKFIPPRRKRKLHIDLFGYARNNNGVHLPRAITFCAALYSLGLPPEILGMSRITPQEIDQIRESYKTIDTDFKEALQYFNKDNLKFLPHEIQNKVLESLKLFEYDVNEEHKTHTSEIMRLFKEQKHSQIVEEVLKAGRIRRFLG
ncbi:MAG: phosphoenolpyruvate carboxylase [Candidatus Woesearchaeota archaeon]